MWRQDVNAFRALITQAQIWKSFVVQNSTSLLYLPIPLSAETWNIFTNQLCQFCFRFISWHFKREKSVFWRASFCKTRTDYMCKLAFVYTTLRLVRISLLISAITKSFAFFSRKLFYKSNKKLFSCVCIAWYKHSRGWENSRQLCKPLTSSRVCITVSNSPNPSSMYIRLCRHGKRFLLLKCIAMKQRDQKSTWLLESFLSFHLDHWYEWFHTGFIRTKI